MENSIAIGSLTATQWNTPAHSADGAERIYFVGPFITMIQVLGAGGTSDTARLWIDCTEAQVKSVNNTSSITTNSKSNLMIVGGTFVQTVQNTVTPVNIFRSENNTTLKGATVISNDVMAIRVWLDNTYNVNNVAIEDCTIYQNVDINTLTYNGNLADAIAVAQTSVITDTTHYNGITIKNNTIWYGKIIIPGLTQDARDNDRFPRGVDIDGNKIHKTPRNAIQANYIRMNASGDWNYVRNNELYDVGINGSEALTNGLQLNDNQHLIVENNKIYTLHNPGGVGDSNGIIIDWWGIQSSGDSSYSDDIIVRRNYIEHCEETPNCAAISLWACTNTEVYGNICVNNNHGISISDALAQFTFTITSFTPGNPSTIAFTAQNNVEAKIGDRITISGVTINAGPDINGTHLVTVDGPTSALVTFDFDSTGGNYSGGTFRLNRSRGNKINNNLCLNNNTSGVFTKFGANNYQDTEVSNNVLSGAVNGYKHQNLHGSVIAGETNNVYWNQSGDKIDNNGSPSTIDATSIDASKNPLDDNDELINSSEFIGKGIRWWTGANPLGSDGYPFADVATDIGDKQTHYNPLHPAYKG